MRTYIRIIRNVIAESAVYRQNQVVSYLTIAFPLVFIIYLWRAVFNETNLIANFTLPSTITYYFLVVLLQDILYTGVKWEIKDDIHSANLLGWMVKPISYLIYQFSVRVGSSISYFFVAAAISICLVFFDPGHLILQNNTTSWLFFIFSLLLSFILAFFLSFVCSLIAFWTLDTDGFESLLGITIPFMSGQLLPITFFPDGIQTILRYTPWRYTLDFPIQVYLGTLSPYEIQEGIAFQLIWLLCVAIITLIIWKYGMKTYQPSGG